MSNEESEASGYSGAVAKAGHSSTHPKNASGGRINVQMVQNVLLIWLDSNIDDSSRECRNTIIQLRRAVNTIYIFTDGEKCIQFLETMEKEKACMIISGTLGQQIIPRLHNMSQMDAIFIFCGNRKYHEQWAKDWSKIKGIFTEIEPICEALKQAAQQCEQNAYSSIITVSGGDVSKKNLNQLDPSFMYTQIMKEIILTITFEQQHMDKFIEYCREILAGNEGQLKHVDQLERTYHTQTPIWWYTNEHFLYSMLNRALRLMDADLVIKLGFFIGDLHRQIEQLHQEQFGDQSSKQPFIVYRGQGMSKDHFEKIAATKGGLLSFNCFLSTSKDVNVSLMFAESASMDPDMVGVLFVMTIDPARSSTPFASIAEITYFGGEDEEVLFSMHTVFRIGNITPIGSNHRFFWVELTLTSDDDNDFRQLTDCIREETFPDSRGWFRLGLVLRKLGQSARAQQVYKMLLEGKTEERSKADIYNQLGLIKRALGEYPEAIVYYEKNLLISKKILPPNCPDLGMSYNNIGNVYNSMGDYPKALSYYEKALTIQQQSLPPNHPDLGMSYNNIGNVYNSMGHYSKALSYYEEALTIQQQSLPPNHPDLGTSYNNIGNVYDSIGDYAKALSYFEKTVAIQQQSLPPNHPHLGTSCNNIGRVYDDMGDYPKALSYFEKAVAIQQQSLPPYHPDLASSYNNIGTVYQNMGDYPKALSSYEKTLAIQQQSLPPNHPDLGMSYNNIGNVYNSMGDYQKALSYYEKALTIQQQSLPPNHPDLGTSYNNIGMVYDSMSDYAKALSYYEKALAIQQQSLPPNHPDLGTPYNNIGVVYESMGDYPRSLSYYEKALAIQQQSLSPNHPHLGTSYNNIGRVYDDMGDYPKALSSFEKALAIQKQSLPPYHPHLAKSYNNIGNVYNNMSEHSKALASFEKAFEIYQKSLPANHSYLMQFYKNIPSLLSKMRDSTDGKTTVEEAATTVNQKSSMTDILSAHDDDKKPSSSDETSHLSTTTTDVQSVPVYYSELIDLSLQPTRNYGSFHSQPNQELTEQLSAFSHLDRRRTHSKSESNNKLSTILVYLDIDSSWIQLNSHYETELFHDECACMDHLLSITDKRVYFIVSASVGEYVVPLVYEHRCIEKIYIYCPNTEENEKDWTTQIPKIRNCWANLDELYAAMTEDIQSNLLHSPLWPGDKLLIRSHTQTLIDSSKWLSLPLSIVNAVHNLIANDQIRVVILHCGRHILFKATCKKQFLLVDFSSTSECEQYLTTTKASSIFFIISGGVRSVIHDLKSITMVDQIYTVYVFLHSIEQKELNEVILQYKNVSGLFCSIKDIYNRLEADIRLYVEESLYMPLPYVFTMRNHMKDKFGLRFTNEQDKFAVFQVFVNILQEVPLNPSCQQKLYDHCLALVENKSDYENALTKATFGADQLLDWFVNVPFLSAILNSLLQQQSLNSFLNTQQIIVTVNERLTELPHTTSSMTVYRAQLMQAHGLDLMKASIGELITFHTFLVATKNILTAREIARQAVDNGLLVVIFEIDVPTKTFIAKLDEDRVIFRFGDIFRIQSIDLAPDAVWHIRLRCADSHFEPIRELIQLQVGERLTWITLGNYLGALQHFDEAKLYYGHLLKTLPNDHEALPSIYNNMGLVFAELGDKEEALECYNTALDLSKTVSSNADHRTLLAPYRTMRSSIEVTSIIDRSAVYDKIAEIYLRQSKQQQAVELYQKALEQTTDPLSCVKFEQKIQEILSNIRLKES